MRYDLHVQPRHVARPKSLTHGHTVERLGVLHIGLQRPFAITTEPMACAAPESIGQLGMVFRLAKDGKDERDAASERLPGARLL